MFSGHFGVALAAKKVASRPSLGTLVLAALLVDRHREPAAALTLPLGRG